MEQLSADLTRFDFHVNRFLGSEDVQKMNSSEVGQYILLLCAAWNLHKSATLPNDEQYLAQIARVPSVSPRVMKKFIPVTIETEDGPEQRLRNRRLYEEWQKASNRYQKFVNGARKTNGKRWGSESLGDSPGDSLGESGSDDQATAIPFHSIPHHTTPDQKDFVKQKRAWEENRLKELEQLRKGKHDDE